MALDEFINDDSPRNETDEIDHEDRLEKQIDECVQRDDWSYGRRRVIVLKVAQRALNMDAGEPMGSRRLAAQKEVRKELDYPNLSSVQDPCGRQLFTQEYVPMNKWQCAFTQLLEEIERKRQQKSFLSNPGK